MATFDNVDGAQDASGNDDRQDGDREDGPRPGEHVGLGGVGTPPEAQAAAGPTEASESGSGPAPAAGESAATTGEGRAGLGFEVTEGEGLGSSAVGGEDLGGFDVGAARLDDTSGASARTSEVTDGPEHGAGQAHDAVGGLAAMSGDGDGDVPEDLRAGAAASSRQDVAGAEDVAGVDEGPATIPTDTATEDDGSSFDTTGAVADAGQSGQDNGSSS